MRIPMRKFFIASVCLAALAIPSTPFASQTLVNEVKDFYQTFEKSMSAGDYETTLGLFDRYIADDFGHYDDGELSYGKEEFKDMISSNNEQKIGTTVDIDMKTVKFSEEKNEIHANFIIQQDIIKNVEQEDGEIKQIVTASMKLECHDYLRVIDPETVKLYKCDCTTLEKFDNRELHDQE